jgi:glucose-6-phosphate 1-dehydrogenase
MTSVQHELRDNTIIIGKPFTPSIPSHAYALPHQSSGHRAILQRRRSVPCDRISISPTLSPFLILLPQTFPALFGLYRDGYLPKDVKIIGYARTKMEEVDFHKRVTQYIKNPDEDQEVVAKIDEFKKISTYISGGYEDDASFENLESHLKVLESGRLSKERNRVFYLALPPSVFIPVAGRVKKLNYSEDGVNRIIVEKPFGKDLESSRKLLGSLKQYWTEDETFRIDHYLGKEMVKNILVLRFANIALSAAWDKNSISSVQITFKEEFGTEGRGGYFDEFGIIRDILQNRASSSIPSTADH